ncbi:MULTISPECIES: ion transporter [Vibrio]|jgi:voltage-gated potassium channel|uniref:Ion transporter n=1 Tax=Vibrio coralliilyticus TaxID=190893 RepID=A0A097QII4_9VIBR|nr:MULTISPECIES: ion transporter [Vibrio]AIU66270.1 ion transporter [Vibrio coralliilyticus]AIW19426.1 ion transporter [Vibrio coralliilyticus]ANW25229.1 ion transporter [Vibrio coralliilyticus]ARC92690.1 ion transporter [Vibrio coralliilyticus]EEX31703.1 potassium voltage-gated channel subfamily KQT [Vibrio coralliilyticus ATCC BAA-450]
MPRKSLKHHLYIIIFGTHTKAGRAFDIALIIAILSSLLVLVLESIPAVASQWRTELRYLEYTFTALFTIEYLLRLYCSPKPVAYAKSFYGVVDLLAILPTYLAFFFPSASFMGVIRLLRVMRIFRVLKLVRYLQDSNILLRSLLMARRKIFIFFSTVAILVTIFGALIFVIEGPKNGFTSIPKSIYWAIVTITTVGYGDLVPQTNLGKAVASITMLLGYSILAVPTGIITAELNQEMRTHKSLVKCPNCSKSGHESDAMHCKHCGSELADPDQRIVVEED